jgi:hypothetical protein
LLLLLREKAGVQLGALKVHSLLLDSTGTECELNVQL